MQSSEGKQLIPLIWPLALGALGGVLLAFLYFVVPRLERGWADTGRQLSTLEIELVKASHLLINWPWLGLLALLGIMALAGIATPRPSSRQGS